MANDYLQMMEAEEAGNDARFQASTSQAIGVNADQAAASRRVAGYLGVPAAAVEAAPEEAERRAQLQRLNADTAAAPVLRRQFTDPDWAKLAHDDSGPLSAVESAVREFFKPMTPTSPDNGMTRTGKFLAEGAKQLVMGATVGVGAGVFDLAALPLDFGSALTRWALPEDVLGRLAANYRGRAQAARGAMDYFSTPQEGNIARGIMSGMRSVGTNLALLPLGLERASGEAVAGAMGAVTGAQAYTEAREKGMGQIGAATYALPHGVFEYAFEKIPASRLLEDISRHSGLATMVARQIVPEVTGEQITTVLQDFNDWVRLNPEKTTRQFIEERPDAAIQTLVATLVGIGVQGGTVRAIQRTFGSAAEEEARAQDAEKYAEMMKQLLDVASGSKLRERSPESFGAFAQAVAEENGSDGNVYVDGQILAQALQQANVPIEQFAEMSPTAAAALADAAQMNGTVAIPVADLVAKTGDTGLEQALLPHLRMTEESLSQEEARQVTEQAQQLLQQESARLMQQASDAEVAQTSAAAVKATLLEQLNAANRFTKDVNDAYASLVSSFYTATAARYGITPEEMYQRYPLKIAGARPRGAFVEQPSPLVAEEVRSWVQETQQRLGLQKFDVQLSGNALKVGLMVVGENERGQGKGTAAMKELTNFADKFGFRVVLSPAQPSDGFGTTSSKRLADFYKRFGFVENKGRAKDFEISEAMYRDPQSLQQRGVQPKGRTVPAAIDAQSNVEAAFAFAGSESFATNRDFKVALQARVLAAAKAAKVDLAEFSAATEEYLVRIAQADGLTALRTNANAVGWYNEKVTKALRLVSLIHPEVATDPKAKFAFVWAMAVTSNGLKVDKNFELAEKVYEGWKTGGAMPTNIGIGTAAKAIDRGLALYNTLIEKHGFEAVERFMTTMQTAGEVEKFTGMKVSGENKTTQVYGAAALGPKIGNGFFMNLYGRFEQLTMDRWLMRTWGRWTATLVEQNPAQVKAKRTALKALIQSLSPADKKAFEGIIGRKLTVGDIDEVAVAIWKASTKPENRERMNVIAPADDAMRVRFDEILGEAAKGIERESIGAEMRKAGNALVKYLDGQKEAPSGPPERGNIRKVFGRALAELQKQHPALTMSDFQALLWYPEKRLYDAAKTADEAVDGYEDDEAPDYANAAAKLARAKGISDDAIVGALAAVDAELQAADSSAGARPGERGTAGAEAGVLNQESPWPALAEAYARYENSESTERDLLEEVQFFLRDGQAPAELQPAVDAYTQALEEDETIYAGRGDSYQLEEAFIAAVERVVGDGELNQGPRGSFSPSSLTISLLEKSDLSTFLHETGHFFLEALADMAAQPNAPADVTADMLTVLEWFGVRTLDEWRAMPLDQQRPHHEKFAESFEQYLFEGKAPSAQLSGLFGRFRAWLTNVYRSLQQFMSNYDTQLSEEVRSVFDRLIATQEEIAQAEEAHGFAAALEQFAGKVDPALLEHYKRLTAEASEEAMARLQARSLRDLKWTVNARSKELKRLTADVAAKRETVEAEITKAVNAMPEVRAKAHLEEILRTTPDVKDARKDWRDRRAAALERTREGVQEVYAKRAEQEGLTGLKKGQYLAKHRREIDHEVNGEMLKWDRANPFPQKAPIEDINLDAIAERFGFTSGDHMLQAIDEFGDPKVAIEGLTNQRMLERYGDLITPEGLQRAASEAVHNEARARAVAAELQALSGATTKAAPTGKTITADTKNGRVQYQQTTNVIVKAARQFAEQLIARQKVREVKPSQHQAAERRAAKKALEAAAAGKSKEAMAAKRDQLLNFYATKEATAAMEEVDKGLKYLKKVADSETLDPDYRDQIAVMLERFDLRPASNKALERRATLLEWVEEQRAMGVEPNIPQQLLDEAQRKSYRDMTVEEFRGLIDTVKQIEHLGRLKHKLLTARDEREFAQVVDLIVTRILESAGDRTIDNVTPNTALGKKLLGLKKFAAEHVKTATWARMMDGGDDGGPLWNYIIRAANHAGDTEVEMRAKATRELAALVQPLLESGKMNERMFIPEIGDSLNRQARIAVALNMGNASNLQRLMGGHNWTAEQVQAIGKTLTVAEWRFVQKVWDYFESYRPLIAAKEKRVSGVEPTWIEATPFEVEAFPGRQQVGGKVVMAGTPTTVKLRGGYYPVRYDTEASHRAEQHADAEGAKQQMRGAYTSATTRRSFTKDRADAVTGRPLNLSLDGIYTGVNEVIHDLSWHEFLIDANRLVGNDRVAAAMRQKYGAAAHQQFKQWLQDVARGETGVVGEGFAGWVRGGVSIAGLGFNIMSAAIQPLGITQSITRIGAKWVGRGVARYVASPLASTGMVHGKSSFMRHRAETRLRELAEIQAKVQGRTKAREALDVSAYYLMLKAQQAVDVPTWIGAYEKATVDAGVGEADAIARADQAVIDSQGSGMLKDQAMIERGGQFKKLLTVFYSFFNTTLNNAVAQTSIRDSKAKLAADYLLLAVVPVVLGALLRDALTPGDSGDWDDEEKIARRLVGEEISFLMGLMFGVREFTSAAQAVTGTAKYGSDYSGPAGTRMIADTTKLAEQAHQGELDPAFRKALVNVAGELLRLPSAQINRSISGYEALRDGKTSNPLAVVLGYQEKK